MHIEAISNPRMLEWARRMSGFELEQAAHKAQVKPDRLNSWERGDAHPSIIQLRKLSDLYRRPLAMFFRSEPPPDETLPSDFRKFDPEAMEPISPELRFAIRDAHQRRKAALDLYLELDEPLPDFSHTANLSDSPEELGQFLRNWLTANQNPPSGDPRLAFNFWRQAAEAKGILVFQAEDVGIQEMRGFSISERPLPTVVLNIKDASAARSFSLLHEITHILLRRGGLCTMEEDGPATEIQRLEKFCNHVAGATLLPATLFLQQPETPRSCAQSMSDNDLQKLASRYGCSPEAVLRRLVILNRVSLAFYRQKRPEYQRQYAELRPNRTGGFAPPYTLALARTGKLFTRLVLDAYTEERITASDMASYLGVRLKHLDRIRDAIGTKAESEGA